MAISFPVFIYFFLHIYFVLSKFYAMILDKIIILANFFSILFIHSHGRLVASSGHCLRQCVNVSNLDSSLPIYFYGSNFLYIYFFSFLYFIYVSVDLNFIIIIMYTCFYLCSSWLADTLADAVDVVRAIVSVVRVIAFWFSTKCSLVAQISVDNDVARMNDDMLVRCVCVCACVDCERKRTAHKWIKNIILSRIFASLFSDISDFLLLLCWHVSASKWNWQRRAENYCGYYPIEVSWDIFLAGYLDAFFQANTNIRCATLVAVRHKWIFCTRIMSSGSWPSGVRCRNVPFSICFSTLATLAKSTHIDVNRVTNSFITKFHHRS